MPVLRPAALLFLAAAAPLCSAGEPSSPLKKSSGATTASFTPVRRMKASTNRPIRLRCSRPTEADAVALASGALLQRTASWKPWYIVSPLEHKGGATEVSTPHSPEDDLGRMRLNGLGPDFEREHLGKLGARLSWRLLDEGAEATDSPRTTHIEFARHLPEGLSGVEATDNAVAYLYREVDCDSDARVPVTLGSDDGVRVWLNGELIHDNPAARGVTPTDDSLFLDLREGVNHLLVKVNNGGGAWGFQMLPDVPLDGAERQRLQPAINEAIRRGVDYLIATQQRDGSWGYHAAQYRNGQTSLSLYALLKSGVDPGHPTIRRGLAYLRQAPPRKTYSLACQILALGSTNRDGDREWMEELLEELLDWQQGEFAYPGGERDLSCTQYGALGYWMAERHGLAVPKRAWVDLAKGVLKYQTRDGGFSYRPGGNPTGSMTVAGLTVISVCRQGFGEKGFPKQWRAELEQAERRGLEWLSSVFSVTENPSAPDAQAKQWKFYYLYGVERLMSLRGLDHLGEHDWYWKGAQHLVGSQGTDGDWSTAYGEYEPNTAFALLFLNRATATVSGPGASSGLEKLYSTDPQGAGVVLRAKGDTPLSLWISELSPALRASHERVGERGAGLYIEEVEFFADGTSIAKLPADSARPWKGQPFATQHTFERRGDHDVWAVLRFAEVEGDERGRPVEVESPHLRVHIDAISEPWMLDYVDDRASNLALEERREASASSRRNDGNAPDKAFDGLTSTAWICAKDDEAPALSVEFKRALRIDRIVLSHAVGMELQRDHFDRATRVELRIGGKREPLVFDVDPDARLKSELVLPRKTKVSRLELRVLERERGTKHPGCVGFAEVELRLGEEKTRRRKR